MRRFLITSILVLLACVAVGTAQTATYDIGPDTTIPPGPDFPPASEVSKIAGYTLPQPPPPALTSDQKFIDDVFYPATVLLFSQNEDGGMKMLCTATAIEKTEKGYVFVTAAHCASKDNDETEKAYAEKTSFFISADEHHTKTFIQANVLSCGYQSRGDDFCLFSVESSEKFPVVRLGEDSTSRSGDQIVNIASPMGLGKQVFYGRVTMPRLDRTLRQGEINWTNAVLVQLPGTNGGSSGSAVVCLDQQAICGFLVGIYGDTTQVAIPVSRFKKFRDEVNSHTYKYFETDPDADATERPSFTITLPSKQR